MAIRFFVATILLVLILAPSSNAITCSDVIKNVRPCINYLKSGSGAPPATCCAGISSLKAAATSTADKITACNCLKNAYKNINLKPELAKALPGNCGISLPYPVSPNVDCSKIT